MGSTEAPAFFTETSAYSLAAVAMIGFTASTAANTVLPQNARWQDRLTFIWLVSYKLKPGAFYLLLMILVTKMVLEQPPFMINIDHLTCTYYSLYYYHIQCSVHALKLD